MTRTGAATIALLAGGLFAGTTTAQEGQGLFEPPPRPEPERGATDLASAVRERRQAVFALGEPTMSDVQGAGNVTTGFGVLPSWGRPAEHPGKIQSTETGFPGDPEKFLAYRVKSTFVRVLPDGTVWVESLAAAGPAQVTPTDGGSDFSFTTRGRAGVVQMTLRGELRGDTLTGTIDYAVSTVIQHVGRGYTASGRFEASIAALPPGDWPPMRPRGLHVVGATPHRVRLAWSPPVQGDVDEYIVYRLEIGGPQGPKTVAIGRTRSTTFDDVAPDPVGVGSYTVAARARNGKQSYPSDPVVSAASTL